jgi:CheY-like chemotaxis protein
MNDDKGRLSSDGGGSLPEKWADDILSAILGLNRAEIADVYRSHSQDDPTQKLYELARIAAAAYHARGEALPAHVQSMLDSARQRCLELEGLSVECTIPKILLVDADMQRMSSRRAIFEAHHYRIEIAFDLAEALEKLDAENFQAVIVEWSPEGPEELDALRELQTWNLQIPIVNVSAWALLASQDRRRFNWNLVRALAKMFGRPVPRKLPERKPVAADSKSANKDDNLFGLVGS